jgi:hypothetical protein
MVTLVHVSSCIGVYSRRLPAVMAMTAQRWEARGGDAMARGSQVRRSGSSFPFYRWDGQIQPLEGTGACPRPMLLFGLLPVYGGNLLRLNSNPACDGVFLGLRKEATLLVLLQRAHR